MSVVDDDDAPNKYVLTPSIGADGSIQLTGQGLVRNTIEVPRGEDAVVKIKDIEGLYFHGLELAIRGERSSSWARNTVNKLTRRKFEAVGGDVHNMVYAVSTNNTAAITYGPVITIKPKG